MPRDPLLPDSTEMVRQSSPDAGGSERKRRRKVLSCYDCRRRKLQCDRVMPACGRCTKAGQASSCLYIDDATDLPVRNQNSTPQSKVDHVRPAFNEHFGHPAQAAPPPAGGDLLSRLEFQDKRIKELEAALSQTAQSHGSGAIQQLKISKLPLTPESITGLEALGNSINATDRETMLLRGKSFKTQFHGISHPGSLIAYIPELTTFTRETFERFPGLARIRQDLHALEDRTNYAGSTHRSTGDADLVALLPNKEQTDEFVRLYLDNYDSIFHIIHLPAFQKEYLEMWSDLANARAHFVAIVLLMVAIVQCIQETDIWLYNANSSTARETAMGIIQPCEDWLQTQSQKHVTVADFQIRFLILLASLVNGRKFKRTWTDAGNLLRFFMAAGLHRSPELLRKPTSALDKEMRRRLWYAAAEFELESSFGRGMISSPWLQQSDYSPPNNIHDHNVDQTSENLPSSRPIAEFTSSSYMVMAEESFALRYTLNTVLNNIRQTISFEDAKRYTEEIETHLQAIPDWVGKSSEGPRALLSTQLRQYLLVLHNRQMRQSDSQTERNFSKMVLVDAATKIMDTYRSLCNQGNFVLHFYCHDQIRVALSVCHAASFSDPQADSMLNEIVDRRATQIVSEAIELISDKITRMGREQRQLWMVLAANAFMKTTKDASRKFEYMQEAVDKITRPYYKIMACQEDAPSGISTGASTGPPTGRADLPDGIIEYLPNVSQPKPNNDFDPPLLDMDAVNAWTFEDWSFNPADFENLGIPSQQFTA